MTAPVTDRCRLYVLWLRPRRQAAHYVYACRHPEHFGKPVTEPAVAP